MSAKIEKKIRKVVHKNEISMFRKIITEACKMPFKDRWNIAWTILFGLKETKK